MAKDKDTKEPQETTPPQPSNRAVKSGMVKVRARQPLGENGYHAKGEEFEVDAKRREALGNLVEDVT